MIQVDNDDIDANIDEASCKKAKKEIWLWEGADKLLEVGYTKTVKRLPQNVVKKLQQMCTTVQLIGEREGGRFCACVCVWGVKKKILSLMFKHFSSICQTFQLNVKTFFWPPAAIWPIGSIEKRSSAQILLGTSSINLPMTLTSLSNARHIFLSNLSNVSVFYEYPNCLSYFDVNLFLLDETLIGRPSSILGQPCCSWWTIMDFEIN